MTMFDRILLAIGGDDPSFEPACVAGRLAAQLGARLSVVSVHRPASSVLGEPYYSGALIPRLTEATSALEQARSIVLAEGAPEPTIEALAGDPAERIADFARRGNFDLIVMGTHRRGRIGAALLGSVSAAVAARAGVPVLVVPEPSKARAQ
jgi:nucleotide-binding universal stress UspA family protein